MVYNLSYMDYQYNPVEVLNGTNNMTGGFLAVVFLMAMYIILLVMFKKSPNSDNFIMTNFIMSILCGLMLAFNVIGWKIAIIPIILLLGGIIVRLTISND